MSEAAIQLPLQWGGSGGAPGVRPVAARREARGEAERLVEYCPYPRSSAAQGWEAGFSRDCSASGMCLEADRGHRVGSLLRITLRRVDGQPTLDCLARVVWCQEAEGGFRLGLELLEPERGELARVRPAALPRLCIA